MLEWLRRKREGPVEGVNADRGDEHGDVLADGDASGADVSGDADAGSSTAAAPLRVTRGYGAYRPAAPRKAGAARPCVCGGKARRG